MAALAFQICRDRERTEESRDARYDLGEGRSKNGTCPSISCAIFGWTPSTSSKLARVRRSKWKVICAGLRRFSAFDATAASRASEAVLRGFSGFRN
jgi:hypothetical protein